MKVVLAGGGTAGHINPALTIARTVKEKNPSATIVFVGNDGSLEQKLVEKAGFELRTIKVTGFKRSLSLHNFKTVAWFLRAVKDCKKLIREIDADVVIGTGGYVSGPAVFAAHALGVKTCIHEQNAFPGMTTKFLSRYADNLFISFAGSEKYFKKAKKITLTGNPLDSAFMFTDKKEARRQLGIPDDAFYLLSFAGSLGAREVNKLFVDFIVKNDREGDFYHTHATGSFGFKWMPDMLKEKGFSGKTDRIQVLEYIYDMPLRLSACDAVVSRAGAITLGEITAQGKPSVLIPSPNVTNNHQYHNAMSLVSQGAAMILEEKDADPDRLYSMILSLKNDPEMRKKLGENARRSALLNASEEIYKGIADILT